MAPFVCYVVLYEAPNGQFELQGAGSARLEAGAIAAKVADAVLVAGTWDHSEQTWYGEGGGRVLVREVEFEYPVGEEQNVGLDE